MIQALQFVKRHTWGKATLIREEIKFVALAVLESEFHIYLLGGFGIDLITFLSLAMPNQCCLTVRMRKLS